MGRTLTGTGSCSKFRRGQQLDLGWYSATGARQRSGLRWEGAGPGTGWEHGAVYRDLGDAVGKSVLWRGDRDRGLELKRGIEVSRWAQGERPQLCLQRPGQPPSGDRDPPPDPFLSGLLALSHSCLELGSSFLILFLHFLHVHPNNNYNWAAILAHTSPETTVTWANPRTTHGSQKD